MNEILIVFASATTATRAKKQLKTAGYNARVIQTPKVLSQNGCGYSVVSTYDCVDEANKIAAKMNIKIKGIFEIASDQYIPI